MREAYLIGGVRTPFVKAGSVLSRIPAQELGRLVIRQVLDRCQVSAEMVDQVIAGNVSCPADAANIARVIALRAGIPRDRIAHTVGRNCASGFECLTESARLIETGEADCIVAVGVESMSNIPLLWNESATQKFAQLARSKTMMQKIRSLVGFRVSDLNPVIGLQQGLTDPVSGLIMGETAEKLAREYEISREDQDRFALRSHQKAVTAWNEGRLAEETMVVYPEPKYEPLTADIGPRAEQSLAALGKMRPYFDRRYGSVTIGNACQVTDGAVGMLLMEKEKAKELGLTALGKITASAYAGCDPARMGLGPVFATAKALGQTDWSLDDMQLVELNEAFAAQVLACQKAFANPPESCAELTGGKNRLGKLDEEKLNVNGGAIAVGHPVGATGTRLALTLLHEMKRRNLSRGLATLCVGGGQGGALILERVE